MKRINLDYKQKRRIATKSDAPLTADLAALLTDRDDRIRLSGLHQLQYLDLAIGKPGNR